MSLKENLRVATEEAICERERPRKEHEAAFEAALLTAKEAEMQRVREAAEAIGVEYAKRVSALLLVPNLGAKLEVEAKNGHSVFSLPDVNFDWKEKAAFSRCLSINSVAVSVNFPDRPGSNTAVRFEREFDLGAKFIPVMEIVIATFWRNVRIPDSFEGMLHLEWKNQLIEETGFTEGGYVSVFEPYPHGYKPGSFDFTSVEEPLESFGGSPAGEYKTIFEAPTRFKIYRDNYVINCYLRW